MALLEALEGEWAKHLTALDEASHKLEKFKDNFREKVRLFSTSTTHPATRWSFVHVWAARRH